MKRIIHQYKKKTSVQLNSTLLNEIDKNQLMFEINGLQFLAHISLRSVLNQSGIRRDGVLIIPKKVADYLKLKNKQVIELKWKKKK